jgi:hypothetical protein
MDSERFDGLMRSFGQTQSRRQTLRGLAGAIAVGAFAVGGREASARRPKRGQAVRNLSQERDEQRTVETLRNADGKFQVCHKGETKNVGSKQAVAAHVAHGDTAGLCPSSAPLTTCCITFDNNSPRFTCVGTGTCPGRVLENVYQSCSLHQGCCIAPGPYASDQPVPAIPASQDGQCPTEFPFFVAGQENLCPPGCQDPS